MLIVNSVEGVPIRLTAERWRHISQRHPELLQQREKVLETLREPTIVLKGDFGEKLAVRHYRKTPVGAKYLVVAYKELGSEDGFVITAYFSREVADWRETLWKRSES